MESSGNSSPAGAWFCGFGQARKQLASILVAAVGCGWAVFYFWKRRRTWDWLKDGSVLILVSILAAPTAGYSDQAVAIPALLHGAYLTGSRILLALLAAASLLIGDRNGLRSQVAIALYLWTAPAWLVWYLLATTSAKAPREGVLQRSRAVQPWERWTWLHWILRAAEAEVAWNCAERKSIDRRCPCQWVSGTERPARLSTSSLTARTWTGVGC